MQRVSIADQMLQWKDLHDKSYNSPESVDIIFGHEPNNSVKNGKVSAQDVLWIQDKNSRWIKLDR